jgi:RNA polymerase sigma-70 factor (ECF subfamily)
MEGRGNDIDGSAGDWIVAVLERYEKPLLRYAAWLLDDAERARDVVQETFLRLCKEKQESVGDHVPQWLFTVCRNLAFDLRSANARTERLDDTQDLDPSDVARALEAVEQQALLAQILAVVEALPKNQREVVYLRFKAGFSYKEISIVTGLSVGNVGFLIHSAMLNIRRRMVGDPVGRARRSHEV